MKTRKYLISLLAALFVASLFHTGCKRFVEEVSVEPSIGYIRTLGGTVTLTHTVYPDNAKNKTVAWKSSDPAIATVEEGVVRGFREGFTTITCTAEDGNFQGRATVCVGDLNGTFYGTFKDRNGNILAENVAVRAERTTNKRGNIFIPKAIAAMPHNIKFETINYTDTEASTIPIIAIIGEEVLDNGATAEIEGGYTYGRNFIFTLKIDAIPYSYVGEKNPFLSK